MPERILGHSHLRTQCGRQKPARPASLPRDKCLRLYARLKHGSRSIARTPAHNPKIAGEWSTVDAPGGWSTRKVERVRSCKSAARFVVAGITVAPIPLGLSAANRRSAEKSGAGVLIGKPAAVPFDIAIIRNGIGAASCTLYIVICVSNCTPRKHLDADRAVICTEDRDQRDN
jgi:hypothetical protein